MTSAPPPIAGLTAVVPAGGAGTRLWPLSRAGSPKFLHDLTGSGRTLLQQTWDRLAPLAGDGFLVVTGRAHVDAVRAQLPELPPGAVIAEPSPRDSMPAIGLAAAVLARRDPEALIGSFAADHVVRDTAAFGRAVADAVAAAREGWLVTIGITPTHPATGFGYIELGEPVPVAGAASVRRAARFVEKPDAARAAWYVESGFRWNAGMFVVRAETLLELLRENHPRLEAVLREAAAVWDGSQPTGVGGVAEAHGVAALERLWPTAEAIAIDHAVAEPAAAAGRVACVPADIGWDDVGDWASLAALLPDAGPGRTRVLGDASRVLALGDAGVGADEDRGGLVVPAGGREVVVVGLAGVVVVDTPDAVLVVPADQAQRVKDVVAALKAAGRTDLL
ncbi:MAG: mannose-1-phosphate guanylyltransferase [Actinomycetales bacterium]